jgi:hypothetical protein
VLIKLIWTSKFSHSKRKLLQFHGSTGRDHTRVDIIKMDSKEIGRKGLYWINLAQYMVQ